MKILAVVAAMIAAGVGFGLQRASHEWQADTDARVAELEARIQPADQRFTRESVKELPPPVARFFTHVLHEGQRYIRTARTTQDAEFFIGDAWRPLTATQYFSTDPVGFVWDARITMAPLFPAYVRDAYVSGRGSMLASVLAAYPLVDQSGKPELDSSALQRFLGESIWLPTTLLPGAGVTWAASDDRTAIATIRDRQTIVSLTFSFNDRDEVTEISGDRFAERDGAYTLRPWRVACGQYSSSHGITIPIACEVSWLMPDGPMPYWRGRLTSIDYEF